MSRKFGLTIIRTVNFWTVRDPDYLVIKINISDNVAVEDTTISRCESKKHPSRLFLTGR